MNSCKSSSLRYILTLVIALSLLIPSASSTLAASSPATSVTVPPGNPIEVAFATWFGWVTAQDMFDAVQMAIDDYGQIKGFDVQRNDYDAGCDTPSGDSAAAAITANAQNVGVVGPFCSSSTQGALPKFETDGFVMISGSNTSPDLHTFGPNAFNRVVVPDPFFDAFNASVSDLPTAKAWETDFENTYNRTPGSLANFIYDATTLLLTRVEQVSIVDGSGNLVIDRQKLRNAVRTTTNFPAVTGPITLDAHGTRVDFFSQEVWNDEFNGPPLKKRWSWLDEDPTHWSLSANPGFIEITTQHPGMNRLVQMTPGKDFVIRTRLLFTPVENFQFAGLTVFNDSDNKLVLGRAFCDASLPDCVGNGIYFDHVENGVLIGDNYSTSIPTTGEAYLRLVQDGSNYTAYVSENGTEWQEIGTHAIGFEPTYIGFYVDGQSSMTPTPANFDFFILEYEKYRNYLPLGLK